ncbi:hypothetical protein ACN47E_003100 [Coniothyrium glycines]
MLPVTISTAFAKLSTGEDVFYREAGTPSSPTVLLLHGFPSSSHQFRKMIPEIAEYYRVIAPDLPAYGFTTVPADYVYTFDNLAATIDTFLAEIPNPPKKYSMYMFDYGAPTGFRLALKNPEKVQAIITQNGNAYDEGLGVFWDPVRLLWASGNSAATREALLGMFTLEATKSQYFVGTPNPSTIAPESYSLDQYLLDQPGNAAIQLDLLYDYRTNLAAYPRWQKWLRESQVPVLVVWGKNDFIFLSPGAEAFKRDVKDAEVHLLDAGHFAAESHGKKIGAFVVEFLKRKKI